MRCSMDVHKLKKSFHGRQVLNEISFQVQENEIFAFLGPNGAGKSTTISILSTLMSFDEGRVSIEGYTLGRQDDAIRNCLGIVFQGSSLDESLCVKQNLLLRCALYKRYGRDAKDRVHSIMKSCGIEDIMQQKVSELSGGQRRKVDIARALIPEPRIMILDEPSTGLDPASRKDLWKLIQHLHHETHMSIFMTTHYMEEAEIADHICMIQKGTIILDGTRKELVKQYCRDQVLLYTDSRHQVSEILRQKHVSYEEKSFGFSVQTQNFFELMSILRSCEHYLNHVEFKKGSIEDMYLQMLKEDM